MSQPTDDELPEGILQIPEGQGLLYVPEPQAIVSKADTDWAEEILAQFRDQVDSPLDDGPETAVQPAPVTQYDRRMFCPNCGHRRNDSDH